MNINIFISIDNRLLVGVTSNRYHIHIKRSTLYSHVYIYYTSDDMLTSYIQRSIIMGI